jgi:hypothetical protein
MGWQNLKKVTIIKKKIKNFFIKNGRQKNMLIKKKKKK